MGWAKYCEDNLSIYNDRVFMAQEKPVAYRRPPVANVKKANGMDRPAEKAISAPGTRRCGLELSFHTAPDRKAVTKLRLNGWWWSKSRSCWCNTNTNANRRFIHTAFGRSDTHLMIVGM